MMRRIVLFALAAALATTAAAAPKPAESAATPASAASTSAKPQASKTTGSVTVGGHRIDYQAVAGTLILHGTGDKEHEPTVSMFYAAYFKQGAAAASRPITFIYNGGPGSATVWLHMGAFGPRRVVTSDDTHTPPAPYRLVNNDDSLLDVSDLVFIDAPGAGFSRLLAAGKDDAARAKAMQARRKAIYSVDGDAHAFAQFITQFLSKYGRWNSPKYLFGESYGTTRSAVLANILTNEDAVDLNGVILLSQILNFDFSIDGPAANPGQDLGYVLALPTYAATAWYHHRLPNQTQDLPTLLKTVEAFALGDYNDALLAGNNLAAERKQAIANQLAAYTGLPAAYWVKADLRVSGGMFEHELLGASDETTGRLDTRFSGPSMDPLGKESDYDPQSSAISSAYIATFNDYVRRVLKFGQGQHYRLFANTGHWDSSHQAPGTRWKSHGTLNVMRDLAAAMKADPTLKVMMNGGYYDLATPFFTAQYELDHLPIPASLRGNVSEHLYPSGHMVYAHEPSLRALHDNVAAFIRATVTRH